MKRILLYSILGMVFLGFFSCHPSSKQDKEATIPERNQKQYYKRFTGTIQGQKVVLHLIKYYAPEHRSMDSHPVQYSGIFIPDSDSMPLNISGYRSNDSIVSLIVYKQFSPVDTFTGKFVGSIFQAKEMGENGSSSSFKLKTSYPTGSYHWQVVTHKDSVIVDSIEKKVHPKAVIDLMTLWPEKDMSTASQRLFKDTVSFSFFGEKKRFSSPSPLLQSVSDSFLRNYRKAVKKISKKVKELEPTLNWNYLAYMNITCNAGNRVSGIFTRYKFLGGAHGLQNEFGYAINLKTGKALQLSDLFKDGYEEDVVRILEKKFRQQYNLSQDEPLDGKNGLLFKDHLPITSNFYLTPHGIGFIYNPYEIAPYVVGIINLYIPFNELKGVLKG